MESFADGRLIALTGDITSQTVDAIVNAANSSLMGGGGVDGAIHRAGGPAILTECRRIRSERYPDGLPACDAVLTTGGKLRARCVIHTVGPVWHGGSSGEDEALASAYRRSLEVANENGVATVAFPAISTGVYHFPKDRAARIARSTIEAFLAAHETPHEVRLVFFSKGDMDAFIEACR